MTKPRTPGWRALRALGWLLLAGIVAIPLAGMAYQALATSADSNRLPAPGTLVDIGDHRLHLLSRGTGSPTVILDGASLDTVSGWHWILDQVAPVTRVIAYDRPGFGWSDLGLEPRDADSNARQLHAALAKQGVTGPYVLVGHSLGGLYARTFAGRYPDEVAGVVLIEAVHPDFAKRMSLPNTMPNADEGMMNAGPYAARLGLLRIMPFIPLDPNLPARQQDELAAYYASSKFADAILSVYRQWPHLLAQARAVKTLGNTRLHIVVGGASDNLTGVPRELQEELRALSSNSRLTVVAGADHMSLVHHRDHARDTAAEIIGLVREIRATTQTTQH